MDFVSHSFSWVVAGLSTHLVEPALAMLHIGRWTSPPREITEALLLAVVQVLVIACVFRPLESWRPLEHWDNRSHTRIDRAYTLIKLLGVLPLFSFAIEAPIGHWLNDGQPDGDSLTSLQHWWPWLGGHPVVLFIAYAVLFDGVQYGVHRLQHAVPWWWALHSLHHSQRRLSCWTNDRDHYLDDFFEAMAIAGAALLIGVPPVDYALLALLFSLLENFSHANVRMRFGPLLDKLLVEPHYHRLHHMRMDPSQPNLHNCNFAFVFPFWDLLFRTALYGQAARESGIGDPVVDADNQRGIAGQQWHTLRRFGVSLFSRAGWQWGDVAFDERLRPVPVNQLDLHALEAGATLEEARRPVAPFGDSSRKRPVSSENALVPKDYP